MGYRLKIVRFTREAAADDALYFGTRVTIFRDGEPYDWIQFGEYVSGKILRHAKFVHELVAETVARHDGACYGAARRAVELLEERGAYSRADFPHLTGDCD
jgi:hypothetical protein